jgi:uncharacterized membrane protein
MIITILSIIGAVFLLGPGAGAVLALSNGFSVLETTAIVCAIHVGLVPVWFGIFELLGYTLRYERRIVSRFSEYGKIGRRLRAAARANLKEFERRVGQLGLGLGTVVFTFLFGISWAAMIAFILNIKRETIFLSVAIGALASGLFWTAVFAGLGWFIPNLWVVYILGMVLAVWFMTYSRNRERRIVDEMAKSLKKIGAG